MAIAFFSTWTTYGTWLPGDQRGWYQSGRGLQDPNAMRCLEAALLMTEGALILDTEQRGIVEKTIALHAVNCRSNHVHVAVTAPGRDIEVPREQFKAWCTRKLKEHDRSRTSSMREHWWTERGWDEYIDSEEALGDVVFYVVDGQGPR
jgi:hypothetical protein